MTRKLWVIATVALFGVSAVFAGIGLTRNASACDGDGKTASTASSSSCCAKDGASSASVDAKKVHKSMVKSAMFAPGAAPILNAAAFGGMLAGGQDSDCDWCPARAAAAGCAGSAAATTASYEALPAGHPPISAAGSGDACCAGSAAAAKVASSEGCTRSASVATVASVEAGAAHGASLVMAGGEGCSPKADHANAAAGGSCCEGGKTAGAANDKCASAKSASLKGKVDDLPYRENKRVVLAGSYECGHCTLQKTEDCAPMLKTADGKVYPLLQNAQARDMRSREGKNVEVSGSVKKLDGVKYIEVKSYRVL
jgi:hypothetical protein